MRLTKLQVRNFKRVVDVEIDLADVNIFVGANSSGKSSILQAVHLACCVMRQADRVDMGRTATVGVDELDYLPTNDYKTLGHGANWGNKAGTPSSEVILTFERPDATEAISTCQLRSARNAGISITGSVPADLAALLRTKRKFFSAYIPGISGIPNKEDRRSKKVILRSCSYGDSNVILRNALLLLKESDENNITLIQDWIAKIIGPITIRVDHDNDRDLYINCEVGLGGTRKPLELVGTGYLQLIQIFCYVLLFNPGILLIDEPDIHLHPDVQERLVAVLSEVAAARGMKILMTTHSPFIVRGAPPSTKVCWLNDGDVESDNRQIVELALGWGAFGKKVLLVSEDSGTALLRKLISQWPDVDRSVAFLPGSGYKSLPSPEQAKELSDALGGKFRLIVHRDRDSMTDAEVAALTVAYEAQGVDLWLPIHSDVEAYFCDSGFIEVLVGCAAADATGFVSDVIARQAATIRQQFESQRVAHNREFHAAGGGPINDDVWAEFQGKPLKGAKGKYVFGQLKNVIPNRKFAEAQIVFANLGGQVALDLKHKIETILAR